MKPLDFKIIIKFRFGKHRGDLIIKLGQLRIFSKILIVNFIKSIIKPGRILVKQV